MQNTDYETLRTGAKQALEDWKAAENFLNFACDPELVECAVYDVEAARRKYVYMLRQVREYDVKEA